ncbi:YidH family protein [Aquabacterium sp. J223]|uniref:YidH family protein n=1 Tax=Aquabacterium sp. J223 TaxID=2898431 RepID=UPI0021AD5D6B|nr:DUF202 domain-containing protein [Aquabacterium sp. J223]UUX95951.1 DUF202 domain-containing protein [Aquabacterium sp. J223]
MPSPPPWRREGQEPDYRFSLANERTFLAWIRTALALVAGAVVLEQLAVHLTPRPVLVGLSASLALLAALLCGLAYRRWRANEIAMRHGQPLPHDRVGLLLSVSTVIGATVIAVLLLGRW